MESIRQGRMGLVSFGPTALDVTGSVEDSMPGLGNYPKLIGKYGYGSAKLLARVLDVCPRAHLFGHIHNATGIHAGQYSIFSNGTVVNEHYEVCKCGNRLVF